MFSTVSLMALGVGPSAIGFMSDTIFEASGDRALGYAVLVTGLVCAFIGVPIAAMARGPVQRAADEGALAGE